MLAKERRSLNLSKRRSVAESDAFDWFDRRLLSLSKYTSRRLVWFDRLTNRFDRLTNRFDRLTDRFDRLTDRFDKRLVSWLVSWLVSLSNQSNQSNHRHRTYASAYFVDHFYKSYAKYETTALHVRY
jgi:hypothetical protein